jgi:DNA replication protein DnaC
MATIHQPTHRQGTFDLAAHYRRAWRESIDMPKRLYDATVETSRPTIALQAAMQWLKDLEPEDAAGRLGESSGCLVLSGPTGTGKSWAFGCLANKIYDNPHTSTRSLAHYLVSSILFRSAPRLARDLTDYRRRHETYTKLSDARLLVLDDLGSGDRDIEATWSVIEEVVVGREADQALLGITTNLPPEILREKLGDRVVDRLATWGRIVVCGGPSQRRNPS